MTTYYVNKDGNDSSGNGLSHATAWLTLNKALGINGIPLTGGPHTLLVGAGTYAESVKLSITRAYGTVTTVQPENPGDSVIITGVSGGINTQINGGATNITFKNLIFSGYSGSTYTIYVTVNNNSISGVTFDSCTITDDGVTADAYLIIHSFSNAGTVAYTLTNCTLTGSTAGVHTHLDIRSTATATATVTISGCNITSAKTGTQWTISAEGTILQMTGCTLTSGGRGIAFGADNTTGLTTGGYIRGCTITCSGNHGVLTGGGSIGIEVSSCTITVVGHCLIDKGIGNTWTQNTLKAPGSSDATFLLKGSTNLTVRSNRVYCDASYVFANYDGVTLTTAGAQIDHNYFFVAPGGRAGYWEAVNNGAGNVIDYNRYKTVGSVYPWGRILGNNCTTLALLKSAWAGYGDGTNESHSAATTFHQAYIRVRGRTIPTGKAINSIPNLPENTSNLIDQGSYTSFAATATAGTYRITPRAHWNSKWAWWAFKTGMFAGRTPHFVIDKANHYNMVANEWLACWASAADTDTWYQFDNVSIGATDLEFYHNTAFPSGTIYVAAMPMYSFARTQRKVAEWSASSLVSSPPSATNYVIGYTTARDNGDARGTNPALPYYGVKIANAAANTKNRAILTSGNHPSENIGRFMLEGAMDWLLTSGYKQDQLLDWFEFYVYPCLNPQGVYGGWFRSSPQNPTTDHNILWNTTGTAEEVDAFRTAWNTDVSNAVEVGLDFHSWMTSDGNKGVAGDSTTAMWVAYIAAVQALGTYSQRSDDSDIRMTCNLWDSWGAGKLNGIPDHGGITSLGISDWKLAGRRFVEALADMLAAGRFANNPGVGSRDCNGTTDRIDWSSAGTLTASALTISLWVKVDALAHTTYLTCIHRSGDAAYGIVFGVTTAGLLYLERSGTASVERDTVTGTVTTGVWTHLLVTHTGTFTDRTTIHIYKNGVECSYAASGSDGSGEYAPTGSWSIAGRKYDDNHNLDGKIAQVKKWNRVLTPTEIASEAAGDAMAASSGLLFYFAGNTSSLVASPGGTGTADGTTSSTGVGNGPTIYY